MKRPLRFVTLLLQLFSDPDIAWDAARAIGCAVAFDGVLDKKNFIVIKVEQQYIVLNYLG